MFFDSLLKRQAQTAKITPVTLSEKNQIYFKMLAIHIAVSYIANTISKCEFKVFENGQEVHNDLYYRLNVSANPNQNAAQLKNQIVWRMPATITPGAATVQQIADFPFTGAENDFWCDLESIVHTQNVGIEPCDFRLRVFGPATNPIVRIGGHPYGVTAVIAVDEYLEIDSAAGTVYQVQSNGTRLNKFNSRNKTQSVFDKVPAGNVDITKNGQYAVEIVLRQKGSVPKWIL